MWEEGEEKLKSAYGKNEFCDHTVGGKRNRFIIYTVRILVIFRIRGGARNPASTPLQLFTYLISDFEFTQNLKRSLSEFSCLPIPNVEHFLRNSAIEFTKSCIN